MNIMKILPLILALLILPSCTAVFAGGAGTALHKKLSGDAARPDMIAVNTAAADDIVVLARHKIDKFTSIKIGNFESTGELPIHPDLGAAIGEQLGQRMAELGFTIGREVQKEPGYFSRPTAILRGTYKVVRDDVEVHLLLEEDGSGRIYARNIYKIPMKRNVRELGQLEDRSFVNMFIPEG